MKKSRRIITVVMLVALAAAVCFTVSGCGNKDKLSKITVVQQYGMAYAPFQIMEQQGLIEKNYDGDIEVEYTQLNSGSSINDSFLSGDVQVGAMGVAPAITGAMSDVGYKICSNMSAQPHKLMTYDKKIKTLKNIKSSDKIALVNLGSIQHILLAMAAEDQLGDAHALDENISAMAHPDGMTALLNKTVKCQLTTSPYTFMEEDKGMTEVEGIEDVWPEGNSFIVAVASKDLHDKNPELYDAVVKSISDAIDYINNNKEDAAKILCKNEDVSAKKMLSWLNDPACQYNTKLKGVMKMAKFMGANDFLETDAPKTISDVAYDNVEGK